ncbi:hypothetical protein HPB50_021943 [Hyalomma asiaticum]|uniref:Uncharacterized protein n=1 Tax=Hyalomma asiaticum TaxID=266040 RepID=A0ACB7SHN4_HYAAI|nr:hypothetical protein HPB50_021943 [Hyalomma asiaticum]
MFLPQEPLQTSCHVIAAHTRTSSSGPQGQCSLDGAAPQYNGPNSGNRLMKIAATIVSLPVLVAAATGMAARIALSDTSNGREHRWNKNSSGGPTFDDLLQALWMAGNESLNPCVNFHQYACYNYHRSSLKGPLSSNGPEEREVLLRTSSNEAGRAIFTYFQSCLLAHWNPKNAVRSAVQALLKMVYVSVDMTELSMFILISKLSLVYDVTTDPQIYKKLHGHLLGATWRDEVGDHVRDCDVSLYVIAQPSDLCYSARFLPRTKPMSEAALEEVTGALNVNVTARDLSELSRRLCGVNGERHLTSSDATVLNSLVPGVSSKVWKDVAEELTDTEIKGRVVHSAVEVLKHRFLLLTDRSLQPLTSALVIVNAAVALTAENIVTYEDPRYYDEFCSVSTRALTPLWTLSHVLSFSAKTEHNHVILRTFDSLVDAIAAEAEGLLANDTSVPVRQLLRKITLVLPYHVYPIDATIPKLGGNFFTNVLLVRQHRLVERNHRAPAGIPQSVVQALAARQPYSTRDYVAIPLAQYTSVALQSSMTLLPMALLGFSMADRIWSAFLQAVSALRGNRSFDAFKCDSRDYFPYPGADYYWRVVEWPLRALRFSVRSLNITGWHQKSVYSGHWRTSMSQVFYRLVMFCHYCSGPHRSVESPVEDATSFIARSADFLQAFDCAVQTHDRTVENDMSGDDRYGLNLPLSWRRHGARPL